VKTIGYILFVLNVICAIGCPALGVYDLSQGQLIGLLLLPFLFVNGFMARMILETLRW
jgi:hypothetical protein